MTNTASRLAVGFAILLALAMTAPEVQAQRHEEGSTWIHRGSDHETMLHANGDSLCTLQFPDSCLGNGMMHPDSIYCEFELMPPDSASHECVLVVHCEVLDDGGVGMMQNHRTPHGLFRRQIQVTLHYDPDLVSSLGIDPENLVVTTWSGDTIEVLEEATQELSAATFQFTASGLSSWYGIADRLKLPVSVQEVDWGVVKAIYK